MNAGLFKEYDDFNRSETRRSGFHMMNKKFTAGLAVAILSMAFGSVSFSQDMPIGTRQGGGASVRNQADLIKHLEKLSRLSAKVLDQVNRNLVKCSAKSEPFSDFIGFYDKMAAKDQSKTMRKCVLTRKVVASLKSMANDPYFEAYMDTRYPNHEAVKREDFILNCIGDGN